LLIVRQQLHHLLILRREPPGFDQHHHHIDVSKRFTHTLVHGFIQRTRVSGLKAGCVDKYKLRFIRGVDARHPVARRLRLARGNADFLPDKAIQQRGFADVGAADNGDQAGTVRKGHREQLISSADSHRQAALLPVRRPGGFFLVPGCSLAGVPSHNRR